MLFQVQRSQLRTHCILLALTVSYSKGSRIMRCINAHQHFDYYSIDYYYIDRIMRCINADQCYDYYSNQCTNYPCFILIQSEITLVIKSLLLNNVFLAMYTAPI